jgi:glucan 1,3-beta-glucosidase
MLGMSPPPLILYTIFTCIHLRLNHVRLPIGYWAFQVGPGEPFIQGQIPYLKKAVAWASNNGLKLIVDLHGAPGTSSSFPYLSSSEHMVTFRKPKWVITILPPQTRAEPMIRASSFDNSGQRKPFPQWHSNQTNIARTDAIMKTIGSMFADDETVTIIAPLNE